MPGIAICGVQENSVRSYKSLQVWIFEKFRAIAHITAVYKPSAIRKSKQNLHCPCMKRKFVIFTSAKGFLCTPLLSRPRIGIFTRMAKCLPGQ
jgi:hypothetical protein